MIALQELGVLEVGEETQAEAFLPGCEGFHVLA